MAPKVHFQGERGAYSESAAHQLLNLYGHPDIETVPQASFEDVFKAVESGEADYGVLPIENSLGGSIHANYDHLLRHNLHIIGELEFRVRHSLLALPGVAMKDVKQVLSHPQALAQCDDFIRNMGAQKKVAYDTAGSAKLVKENNMKDAAAICSKHAANIYDMNVLAEGIEDEPNNYTRFLLMSRDEDTAPAEATAKTSIVFALKDTAGVLFKALSVFALRDIDLTKIESRPAKGLTKIVSSSLDVSSLKVMPSYFYLDFSESVKTDAANNALRHLGEIAPFIRVLGSYALKAQAVDKSPSSPAKLPEPTSRPRLSSSAEPFKVGILGFGNFGQFLAKTFVKHGWTVSASSRSDYSDFARSMGVHFTTSTDDFFSQGLDVVVLCMSILSFEKVLSHIDVSKLANCLVVDVLSVKIYPKQVLSEVLLPSTDLMCTHPMFGPESGKNGWTELPFVYENVRVTNVSRGQRFLSLFEHEGCRMIEMSCEQHDEYAANSQFVTHLTGRILAQQRLQTTPINTKGYDFLLGFVENTCQDSFELFDGLYRFNPKSKALLQSMESSFQDVKRQLVGDSAGVSNDSRLNPRVAAMRPSKTMAVTDKATQLRSEGKDIISLSVGEPDFDTPKEIADAGCDAIRTGKTRYTPLQGEASLRAAICQKLLQDNGLSYTPDEVVCTNGAKQAIQQSIMAFVRPGEDVIIPAPFWVSYPEMVRLAGGNPVIVNTQQATNYMLQPSELEAVISANTRMIILCTPSNPTGSVYSKPALEALAGVLDRFPNTLVISDEIYEFIVYDGAKTESFAALPGQRERTLTVNGFSKSYAMTGWRLGYVAAPLWMAKAVAKIQSQVSSSPNSISQAAGEAALRMDMSAIKEMVVAFDERRKFVVEQLLSIPGVSMNTPNGAFYAFPDVSHYYGKVTPAGTPVSNSEDVSIYLLDVANVATVPGSAFGDDSCIRLSYATSMDTLKKALSQMKDAFGQLK